MSYHIYTTKGLVISARPLREADRLYTILTRDLGLIRASATGVRKGVSKLRGALEPLVLVNVSLVRGKEYWRITSAEALRAVSPKVTTLRPLALLEKLVQGEHVEPELFDVVEANLENDETLLVANIMHKLGYLRGEDLNLDQKALVQAINKGLELTHLT